MSGKERAFPPSAGPIDAKGLAPWSRSGEGADECAGTVVGVEIGATKQQIALVDERRRVTHGVIEKIPLKRGAQDILDWLETALPPLLAGTAAPCGIGVGFGGIVRNPQGETLRSIQVDGWDDFPLKDWFEKRFSLPCRVYNDTYCGGYGELLLGAGRDARRFFYSNIGSGIGGSFFPDRKPLNGNGYGNAYFGHTYIPDRTRREPFAFRKVEEACSGLSIESRLRTPGYVPEASALWRLADGDPGQFTCKLLGEAVEQGDGFALGEIKNVAQDYALGLANLVALLSPDVVAIGGGVAHLGELLLKPLREYANELACFSAKDRFQVRVCQLADSAVAVGAALMMRDGVALE